jgi:mannose-6-phosphate isomerase-like protein (cupin superfamily)
MQTSSGDTEVGLQELASNGRLVDLLDISPIHCPCGVSRRAFTNLQESPTSVHLTDISRDARTHYHRQINETYVILECEEEAAMELDGEMTAVEPLMAVFVPAGVRHRAVGEMRVIVFCSPKFDPDDEFFD